MKTRFLGTYKLGADSIRVLVASDNNGSFTRAETVAEMVIGIDCSWGDVVGILLHEAMEYAFSTLQCRYRPDIDMAQSSDGYTFHATHPQFAEIVAQVGYFVSAVLPDLAAFYRAFVKAKRKLK